MSILACDEPWLVATCCYLFDFLSHSPLPITPQIRGIPSLIIVDGDGKVVTKEGRSEVMNDPTGEGFPYIPKSPKELLTTTGYVDRDGTTYEASHLDGKTILLCMSRRKGGGGLGNGL